MAFRVHPFDALERVAGGGNWQWLVHGFLLPEAAAQMKVKLFTNLTKSRRSRARRAGLRLLQD
jgi:hypothetical protein